MLSPGSYLDAESQVSYEQRNAIIWRSAGDLLLGADPAGVRVNKLGPLAARIWREQGRAVPPAVASDARLARAAWMSSIQLLGQIRSLCEGPLLLIKGPEVAALYPGRARGFMDLDLISPDAAAVHAALKAEGFVEVEDPELFRHHHHLRPLQLPENWLRVEIHERPGWPPELPRPPVLEMIAGAVPSLTGVPGISAPDPASHAIILASHAWVHEPLNTLRDLIDVAAVAARADETQLAALARHWGIERIWRTTYEAANGLLGSGRPTRAVQVWARHLPVVTERTVLGNHLQRWLSGFWGLPTRAALRWSRAVFRQELFPYPDESWGDKLIRVRGAFTKPRSSMSTHTDAWQEAAQWHQPGEPGRRKDDKQAPL